jgi:hypothetical protein
MNETRTTRIIALMAGNGFFVSQLGVHWLEHGRKLETPAIITAVVALIGLSLAYLSLYWPTDKGGPALAMECFAAVFFLADAVWYLMLSAGFFY